MNDEYLWNKTGEDPEIEKLETALAAFRYRDAAPPAVVPQYEVPSEKPRGFRITFAFAFASLAVAALLAVVSLQISNDYSESENAHEIVFVQQEADIPEADPPVEQKLPPVSIPAGSDRPTGNRRRTVTRASAAIRHRTRAKDLVPDESVAALTKEERFAYRQLMLALSITSSKLKIVQDAIDGTGAAEENDSKNQR